MNDKIHTGSITLTHIIFWEHFGHLSFSNGEVWKIDLDWWKSKYRITLGAKVIRDKSSFFSSTIDFKLEDKKICSIHPRTGKKSYTIYDGKKCEYVFKRLEDNRWFYEDDDVEIILPNRENESSIEFKYTAIKDSSYYAILAIPWQLRGL